MARRSTPVSLHHRGRRPLLVSREPLAGQQEVGIVVRLAPLRHGGERRMHTDNVDAAPVDTAGMAGCDDGVTAIMG